MQIYFLTVCKVKTIAVKENRIREVGQPLKQQLDQEAVHQKAVQVIVNQEVLAQRSHLKAKESFQAINHHFPKRNRLVMINFLTVRVNQAIAVRLVKISQKVVGIKNRLKRNRLAMINFRIVLVNQVTVHSAKTNL